MHLIRLATLSLLASLLFVASLNATDAAITSPQSGQTEALNKYLYVSIDYDNVTGTDTISITVTNVTGRAKVVYAEDVTVNKGTQGTIARNVDLSMSGEGSYRVSMVIISSNVSESVIAEVVFTVDSCEDLPPLQK